MEATKDHLSFANEPKITKLFDPDESVVFSDSIYKFNPFNWKQKRNMLITTKNIYNLKSHTLKRRISLMNLAATTVSEDGSSKEFVIHIPDEYDYRYTSER